MNILNKLLTALRNIASLSSRSSYQLFKLCNYVNFDLEIHQSAKSRILQLREKIVVWQATFNAKIIKLHESLVYLSFTIIL